MNRVIETASSFAVNTCGATVWLTQEAFAVAVDGVLQMFGLAALPTVVNASRDPINAAAATTAKTPGRFHGFLFRKVVPFSKSAGNPAPTSARAADDHR
ncbi:MAG: hypothetical protein ACXVY6_11795 [Gaiellaceae bacterium]